jgi:formate dehydrogenase gamma subunit
MALKETPGDVYWRFNVLHRSIHMVMMVTFVGLALTGLPLKYPNAFWAPGLMGLWGGVNHAGTLHRWLGGITFGYFFLHLFWVLYYRFILKGSLLGSNSMVPSIQDVRDFRQHIRYFLGKGNPPSFGRFTYWEKFDYWAVFWGIAFIGSSGLVLWFPEFFSRYLPGYLFNVATIIHSDEALLAMGFIFIVHLFNAHMRAGIFPMDRSIFTGKMSALEMKQRHPLEWEEWNRQPEKKARRRVRKDLFLLMLSLLLAGMIPSVAVARGMTDEERMEAEKKLCWNCHRQTNLESNEGALTSLRFCMECHGKKDCEKKVEGKPVSLYVDEKEYAKTTHRRVPCIRCHVGIATSPHRASGMQCASCHGYHGEGTAHDPHRTVTCEACHVDATEVTKDQKTGNIVLAAVKDGLPLVMTSHRLVNTKDKKTCEKCHRDGNRLGAPVVILPAKSVICIGCHSSSITANDPISAIALLLFLGGMAATLSLWLRSTVGDPSFSTHQKISYLAEKIWQVVFSKKILTLFKVLFFDVLLLRRILKESLSRWTIHSLIYLPFFLRFFIGMILLILSGVFPMSPAVASLVDKNNPFIAFTYDLLGSCVMLGIAGATMRRARKGVQHTLTGSQDVVALVLMGVILITGFIVEGMRILVTMLPTALALPSFIGFPISRLLALFPLDWQALYPYGWYLHAMVTGMFVAYLPMSKMFHLVVSPLVLLINALDKEE